MKALALVLAFAVALPAAEDGGQTAAWSKLAVGARASALGRAVGALADEADAVQANPALAATQSRANLGSQYAMLPDERSLSFIGLARPFEKDSPLAWGLSYLQFGVDAPIERRQSNTPTPDSTFRESASQTQLTLAGWVWPERLALGLGLKVYSHMLGEATGGGASGDLGAYFRAFEWLDLGLAAKDPYSRLGWSTGWGETMAPSFRASASLHPWGERLQLSLESEHSASRDARLHAGLEGWPWAHYLALRLGWDDGLVAAGFGLRAPLFGLDSGLDYALCTERSGTSQWQHRISLHLGFDL